MTLSTDALRATVEASDDASYLRVDALDREALSPFDGETRPKNDGWVLRGDLSEANAAAVRRHFPWLEPRPLGLRTSAGVGDRLGLATAGHARAFRLHGSGVAPVFAQQSIREMDRLGRDPQQVLDDATFGCLQAGWELPVGADADHLKTTKDIDRCLAAGFTSFTIDPGDHVVRVDGEVTEGVLEDLEWDRLEDRPADMLARYAKLRVEIDGRDLSLPSSDVALAAVKYSGAVLHAAEMFRHLSARARREVEVEVSVDETDEPTTLVEHAYLSAEMERLGLRWVSFAPRYIGGFEKGIDYIGDREVFARELSRHAQIARQLGPYKMSLHSGSDKFSIYELAADVTGGLVHLKTSGTTYLVALGIVAQRNPELFRAIYERSRASYRGTRASYQVSARLERAASPSSLQDDDLVRLLDAPDSRQILHVGFGAIIGTDAADGGAMARELRRTLCDARAAFDQALETHIGRHLRPFAGGE